MIHKDWRAVKPQHNQNQSIQILVGKHGIKISITNYLKEITVIAGVCFYWNAKTKWISLGMGKESVSKLHVSL